MKVTRRATEVVAFFGAVGLIITLYLWSRSNKKTTSFKSHRNNFSFALSKARGGITDEKLEFLSQYTRNVMDKSALREHVMSVIEAVEKSGLHVYRCIGRLRFLTPKVQESGAIYHEMIKKPSAQIADVGCAFGQETRKLILDGVQPQDITVFDLHDGYWNLGMKLFMDEGKIAVNQVFGDLAASSAGEEGGGIDLYAKKLVEKFDFVFALAVLHCLSEEQVNAFVGNVFRMMKTNSQAKFFGVTGGTVGNAGNASGVLTPSGNNERFLHTAESLTTLLTAAGFINVKVTEIPHELTSEDKKDANWEKLKSFARIRLAFEAEKM
eukprot:TRINITY_DN807_c0_g1_i1.p1 TRINITY_DN807_c0_g1~~TRINITY_DN807_c0_g1_i1.p1  ORF type:complete len:324 (+),score=96.49 TRINITY_DN807_c0_g1_i1:1346-2317(+)